MGSKETSLATPNLSLRRADDFDRNDFFGVYRLNAVRERSADLLVAEKGTFPSIFRELGA